MGRVEIKKKCMSKRGFENIENEIVQEFSMKFDYFVMIRASRSLWG